MADLWYALHVKPHKERVVTNYLSGDEALDVFFPSMKVTPKNPRAAKVRPYFPGYIFVRIDLEERGSNALQWTPGAKGLVRFGNEAAVVPEGFIQELQKRLALLSTAALTGPKFIPGERVRIIGGPFEGYEAIFDWQYADKDRVQVLLKYLSDQYRRVKLDATDIGKVKG